MGGLRKGKGEDLREKLKGRGEGTEEGKRGLRREEWGLRGGKLKGRGLVRN
jgi:hypothetical protein